MTKKLKWPLRIGGKSYPAGTQVRLATLQEAQAVFPAIRVRDGSTQVAVWFDELPHPTIVHRSQLE